MLGILIWKLVWKFEWCFRLWLGVKRNFCSFLVYYVASCVHSNISCCWTWQAGSGTMHDTEGLRDRAPQKGLLGCCDTAAVCQWRNEANPSSSACICINNTAEQHGIQLYTREDKINARGREQWCVMLPVNVCTYMFCQPVTITQHDKAQHIYIRLCVCVSVCVCMRAVVNEIKLGWPTFSFDKQTLLSD